MSISLNPSPINRNSLSTGWTSSTRSRHAKPEIASAATLYLIACGATLTIWNPDPFLVWAYEIVIFILAGIGCVQARPRINVEGLVMVCISLWGFIQLTAQATVYRWATLNAALRNAALAATALAGFLAFRNASIRTGFLRAMVWFGVLQSVASVLGLFHFSRANPMGLPQSIPRQLGSLREPQQLCTIS